MGGQAEEAVAVLGTWRESGSERDDDNDAGAGIRWRGSNEALRSRKNLIVAQCVNVSGGCRHRSLEVAVKEEGQRVGGSGKWMRGVLHSIAAGGLPLLCNPLPAGF